MLNFSRNLLICHETVNSQELDYIKQNFCGQVFIDTIPFQPIDIEHIVVYLCGNIEKINLSDTNFKSIFVITNLSTNYTDTNTKNYTLIHSGQVPINICDMGVFYRQLFNVPDFFQRICNEHEFQNLTESNKPSNAFRKGVYLSRVNVGKDGLEFNLLRCSSNLDGPTENFKDSDNEIINSINTVSQQMFENPAECNHVLAQIYRNFYDGVFPKKAKIKAHSDKTKDMPNNGLLAFCTFYDSFKIDNTIKQIGFDYCYKKQSILTKLHFKLKAVENTNLKKEFTITLFPNSVFIIPLSTNRLYTHSIVPSNLPIEKLPTRMGYVVRCSKTVAVYNNKTFIKDADKLEPLYQMTPEEARTLKDLYFEENTTTKPITYNKFFSSMNKGDYLCPKL